MLTKICILLVNVACFEAQRLSAYKTNNLPYYVSDYHEKASFRDVMGRCLTRRMVPINESDLHGTDLFRELKGSQETFWLVKSDTNVRLYDDFSCFQFRRTSQGFEWEQEDCESKRRFVCKRVNDHQFRVLLGLFEKTAKLAAEQEAKLLDAVKAVAIKTGSHIGSSAKERALWAKDNTEELVNAISIALKWSKETVRGSLMQIWHLIH